MKQALFASLIFCLLLTSCGTIRNVVKNFTRTDTLFIQKENIVAQNDIKAFRTIEEFSFSEREYLPESLQGKDSLKIITTTVYQKAKNGNYKKTTEYLSDNSSIKQESKVKSQGVRVQREIVKEVPPGYFIALALGIFWLTILTIYLLYRHFAH